MFSQSELYILSFGVIDLSKRLKLSILLFCGLIIGLWNLRLLRKLHIEFIIFHRLNFTEANTFEDNWSQLEWGCFSLH